MNVTEVPEQVGFTPEVIAILTVGVTEAVTPSVIVLLVAVGAVLQLRLLVITQLMSPPVVPASV